MCVCVAGGVGWVGGGGGGAEGGGVSAGTNSVLTFTEAAMVRDAINAALFSVRVCVCVRDKIFTTHTHTQHYSQ